MNAKDKQAVIDYLDKAERTLMGQTVVYLDAEEIHAKMLKVAQVLRWGMVPESSNEEDITQINGHLYLDTTNG